jgi:hypothetical protein
MADIERLKTLRQTVLTKRDGWDQRYWAAKGEECGTTMCLAGWTCHLFGEEGDSVDWNRAVPIYANDGDDTQEEVGYLISGESIEKRAEELLGLDIQDAMELFWATDEQDALSVLDDLIERG